MTGVGLETVVRTAQNLANRTGQTMYIFYDDDLECYAIESDDWYATKALEIVSPILEE